MSAALSTVVVDVASCRIPTASANLANAGACRGSSAHGERPLIVASDDLLQGRRELWIEHRGEMYRLRLTAAGKLYMTK